MVGYVDSTGRTILTAITSAPPSLLNSTGEQPGRYVFGHYRFHADNFHLTSTFHRKYAGNAEDFILGFLSVVLIAAISEIVHSLFMRTRGSGLTENGLRASYLIDEFYHLRNFWSFFFGKHGACRKKQSTISDGDPDSDPDNGRRGFQDRSDTGLRTTIVILFVSLIVVTIDVLAVYLTQPTVVFSSPDQYSIRALQPAATSHNLSSFIRRISLERTCVTPIMINPKQRRNFFVSACIRYDDLNIRASPNDVTENLTISSFFHRGGSDHIITFGNSLHRVKTRTLIFPNPEDEHARRVLYTVLDDANFTQTKYLQDVTVHAAIEWVCNKDFSTRTCAELVDELQILSRETVREKIIYWEGRQKTIAEQVTGVRTVFQVRLQAPTRAVQAAGRVFATSAVLDEVAEPGDFTDVTNERRVPGLAGMISEEGRVAGIILLTILVSLLVAVLIMLRIFLKPVSLAHVARYGICEKRNGDSDSVLNFEEPNNIMSCMGIYPIPTDASERPVETLDGIYIEPYD